MVRTRIELYLGISRRNVARHGVLLVGVGLVDREAHVQVVVRPFQLHYAHVHLWDVEVDGEPLFHASSLTCAVYMVLDFKSCPEDDLVSGFYEEIATHFHIFAEELCVLYDAVVALGRLYVIIGQNLHRETVRIEEFIKVRLKFLFVSSMGRIIQIYHKETTFYYAFGEFFFH